MSQPISRISPAKIEGREQRIPCIVHQTFRTSELPDGMRQAAMSWVKLNPNYDYHFYSDEDHLPLLEDRFGPRVASAYAKLNRGAFKADLWRYCILHEFGGVYADIDSVCRTPLNKYISTEDEFGVPTEIGTGGPPYSVFNALIFSVPGHPFLARAIEFATEMIHSAWTFEGFSMVGPGALGAGINLALSRDIRTPHSPGVYEVDAIRYRILEKRPAIGNVPPLIVSGDETLVQTRYDGYFGDLEHSGVSHWLQGSRLPNIPQRIVNRIIKASVVRKLAHNQLSPLQYP